MLVGDMLDLPYEDKSFDCVLCRNVISHTDTRGVRKIAKELYRVLRTDGECFLTLGSKNTWGFRQDWPSIDENTKLRMEKGPEYEVPHFYADYDLCKDIFRDFILMDVSEIKEIVVNGKEYDTSHWHLLIKKP
jgi:ubiquinone/menaquinone biosynthesis C-methylase UbiE